MKQIPSHSNTPTFGVKSQTTSFLYQPPTKANTVRYKSKSGLVGASLFVIAVVSFSLFLKGCADDVDRQQTASFKYQEQTTNLLSK
ncbi:hypothetical protein [Acinetobacter sp. ANC 4558]|uniref:hypothetical protein n=1 Tax=Acinetobacter sp. ANC 4558 TaxID=1977876 RepID=UPI00111C0094|nr:hypothetical protein [Acinetobacter sp. ANC 4558]